MLELNNEELAAVDGGVVITGGMIIGGVGLIGSGYMFGSWVKNKFLQ